MNRRAHFRAKVAEAKARASISQLIGETLPLKRNGVHLTGLCPFHAEHTPSFYVYKDHFHCFGCGAQRHIRRGLAATVDAIAPIRGERLGGRPSDEDIAPALAVHRTHIRWARNKSGGAPREGVHPFALRPGEPK